MPQTDAYPMAAEEDVTAQYRRDWSERRALLDGFRQELLEHERVLARDLEQLTQRLDRVRAQLKVLHATLDVYDQIDGAPPKLTMHPQPAYDSITINSR